MKAYCLYLVDMDDTLYEEWQYVLSGFRAVSVVAAKYVNVDASVAYDYMVRHFECRGRSGVFDAFLQANGIRPEPEVIQSWVSVYRDHQPEISPYAGVLDALVVLRRSGACVCVVTDGLTSMQERKFKALRLGAYVDRVVYCHQTGFPKPDPRALAGIVRQGQGDAVMVGDRPDHDLALAAGLEIDAVRIRTPRFKDHGNAPWEPVGEFVSFTDFVSAVTGIPLC
jgi:putative hydrolase of the HAD superfamily